MSPQCPLIKIADNPVSMSILYIVSPKSPQFFKKKRESSNIYVVRIVGTLGTQRKKPDYIGLLGQNE